MRDQRRRNGHNGRKDQLPASWISGWFDPELEELFRGQPELKRTAHLLHAARPETAPDPRFRSRLRASLMTEAHRARARRRRWFFGPVPLAWTGAGVGIAAMAATVLTLLNGPAADHQAIVALSNVSAHHSVSPDDVITVAFNQPMDQQAVVAGLHVQPATQVRTTWKGNNLLITPIHHLTGNTPYTVTIERSAARTASGATAPAPIQITFGTAPAPPRTTAVAPPSLETARIGDATAGASVLFGPDGSVLVTSGPAPAPVTASPGGSPSAQATSSPVAGAAGAAPAPALLLYPAGGGNPTVLGAASNLAAFSPNGGLLAAAVHDGTGVTRLLVVHADGSFPATLTTGTTGISSLAWASNRRLVYATSDNAIRSIDLTGVAHTLAEPGGTAAIRLSPDGRHAYLAPTSGTGGQLLDIDTGAKQPLAGAGDIVAFSADGSTVAWIDESQTPAQLQTELLSTGARVTVSRPEPSADVTSVALSSSAGEIAYVEQPASGAARLAIAQLPSGSLVAVGPAASSYAFSQDGISIALLRPGSTTVSVATVPGVTQPTQSAGLPAGARTALQAFIDAQVGYDADALTSLSAPGAQALAGTPKGLSRGYLVSAAANPDGTITATVELIVDSTGRHPLPQKSDETLTLARKGADTTYLVTSIAAGSLRDELRGPHVVAVTTAAQHTGAVVQINFDSDLDRATVPTAITLVAADGSVITARVVYNEDTRSATVTLSSVPSAPITVSVAASLRDVDGQTLAAGFSARAGF